MVRLIKQVYLISKHIIDSTLNIDLLYPFLKHKKTIKKNQMKSKEIVLKTYSISNKTSKETKTQN